MVEFQNFSSYNNYLNDELMTAVNDVNNFVNNPEQERLETVEEETIHENSCTLNDSRLHDAVCSSLN
jgi:hypothetical protein